MKRIPFAILSGIIIIFITSCQTNRPVERVSSETTMDLSGYWNDADVKIAAKEIISSCLESPRISQYSSLHGGKRPVVIIGSYRNQSDEHIDTGILTKQLEADLINSGIVDFVASRSERSQIRSEREDQQKNASEDTAKNLGNEIAADFILQGMIKTIVDSNGDVITRTYYISTEMIDIETNMKIWVNDNSSIKKVLRRSKLKM